MLQITLLKKANQIIGYEVSGHAGFAQQGKDIVCSAVSVLSINTLNAISSLTSTQVDATTQEDGYMYVVAKSKRNEQSQVLLDAYELGVTAIQAQYNDYIQIGYKEV